MPSVAEKFLSVAGDKPPAISTTLKLDNFLSKPLRDAALSSVPGVGPVTLAKLKSANIETATQLMGHFLLTGSDTVVTTRWLKEACEVRETEATKVAEALRSKAERITADHCGLAKPITVSLCFKEESRVLKKA